MHGTPLNEPQFQMAMFIVSYAEQMPKG